MSVTIEDYSTNEFSLAKMLFELKHDNPVLENRIVSFVSRMVSNNYILRLVSRYLLCYRKPEEVKLLLRRYVVYVAYITLAHYGDKPVLDEEDLIPELEDFYYNGLTIKKLEQPLSDYTKYMAKLYECNIKTFNKDIESLRTYLNIKFAPFISFDDSPTFFALYNVLDYFQMKTKFHYYNDKRKSCDLIVAESLTNMYFADFTIDISDEEIKKNLRLYPINDLGEPRKCSDRFLTRQLPQMIRNAKIVVGYIVNDLLARGKKVEEVKALHTSHLAVMTLDSATSYGTTKVCKQNYIQFLKHYEDNFYLDLEKVVDFKLTYNGEDYLFTKEGLIKL